MKKLKQLDKDFLWHPFTQQNDWENEINETPLVIAKGKGNYLYDIKGKRYLDGISSLWANLHGHRHPLLDSALSRQLKKVSHSTFLGLTHEPGIRLAQELVRTAPQGLSRVFYSDNGSTAAEVALKMAFQYHVQTRRDQTTRSLYLSLKNSYHGDTIGSVSVGGIDLFHKKFEPLLFKPRHAMSPHCTDCIYNRKPPRIFTSYHYKGEKPKPGDFRRETGCRWECLKSVETILKHDHKRMAAAIIEPIVQGAGGILVMPPGYLWGFARLCRKYQVLLIADEVATGFGRTGKMFACENEKVRPDLLCLAKGLSGGYLPLAATLTTEKIYRAFLGRLEEFKTFFHGHTYTANPLACETGRASLSLINKKNFFLKIRKSVSHFKNILQTLAEIPKVKNIRQAGLMIGIEIVPTTPAGRPLLHAIQAAKRICQNLRKSGVLLRPLGNVIVLMPPLSLKENQANFLIRQLKKELNHVS